MGVIRAAQFAALGFGCAVCALNFYLSFVRYANFYIAGPTSEYRFVSGIPLTGSLVALACFVCFRLPHWAWLIGIICALADTGGIHWFLGTMLWHAGDHGSPSEHQG
jgi:hypothetical protein